MQNHQVKGELPSCKLYEDDTTISIMDIADDVDGHILVIPKKHFKNILDCDSDALHGRYRISISTSFRASAMTALTDGLFSRAPKRATRIISKN